MRVRNLLLCLVAVLLFFGAGWGAARAFQSPSQRAADERPPAATPILEPVVVGSLADQANVRATVAFAVETPITLVGLSDPAVVTANVLGVGAVVQPGRVALEVNGRPVFVLPGAFPFYRDIGPGAEGPDVTQLQDGLVAAGYSVPRSEASTYGRGTQAAVKRLYEDAGYESGYVPDPRAQPEEVLVPTIPVVPRAEVVTVHALPATLTTTSEVGGALDGSTPAVTLASGDLVARANLPGPVAVRTTNGLTATLATDDGRSQAAVVSNVTLVGATTGPDADAAPADPLVVMTPTAPLPADWLGLDVLATISLGAVSESGLIVPTRAVAAGSDGTARVTRVRPPDDVLTRVDVVEVQALGGRSLVRPVQGGALVEGDMVQVG